LLISDLRARLEGQTERSVEATLGDISVAADASTVTIADENLTFPLDERAERSFGKYLGVPKAYLEKCPPDHKAYVLNYWLQRKANAAGVIELIDDRFINVHKPGLVIIPIRRVVDVISNTLDPSYEIKDFTLNDTKFQIDVITPHTVEVEPWSDVEDRNPEHHATVGDITHGGIRFVANPTEAEAPQVLTYLHRLWCSNGSTSPVDEGTLRIKGTTVDEILIEMEGAMRRAVGDLDNKLAAYAALSDKYPPGSKDAFARQLGLEYKVSAKILNKILDRVQILPDGASLYDIAQVFTAMANEEGIPAKQVAILQEIGGQLAFNTDEVTHRCGMCERLLP
jgi:hypothetical protein